MPINDGKFDYWQMMSRQKGIINREEQIKIKNSLVTIIGCGGIGGAAAEMLVRMGVGKIKVIDNDHFEFSNLNRQLMSTVNEIGSSKAKVTGKILQAINPSLEIKVINEELNQENVAQLIEESHVVIDAVDNLITRIIVSRNAYEINIPFIHGAIHATKGQVTTYTRRTPTYEKMFQLPSQGKKLTPEVIKNVEKLNEDVPPSISSVPNIVGCLQAFEALKIIISRGAPIMAPEMLTFDLLKKNPFSMITI